MTLRSGLRAVATALAVLLGAAAAAQADVVIFKDGFVIYGKVSRDGETITDPSGQAFSVPKGPFFLLDGARRIYFSRTQVLDANSKDIYEGSELIQFNWRISRLNAGDIPPLLDLKEASPWNDHWERTQKIGTFQQGKPYTLLVDQRITSLTPQGARVDALKRYWTAFYQIGELGGPEIVRTLLSQHPDLTENGKNDAGKRFRIYRFLVQAGWYDAAEAELDGIAKDFPKEKDKLPEARKHVKKLKTMQLLEEIEIAEKAGRHGWVEQKISEFPRGVLDEQLSARVRILAEKYEAGKEALKQARRLVKTLPSQLPVPAGQKLFTNATETIAGELTLDNVDRLEVFVKLALQAERDLAQGRKPDNGPLQLLCMAMTGWTLGKDSSDAKLEVAERLWSAREFLVKYLKTEAEDERARLLTQHQARKAGAVPVDELAAIIRTLPPATPDTNLQGNVLERELKTGRRTGIKYLVQMPAEYEPTRAYPVVFALAHGTETPKDVIARCSEQALRYGFILVAPEWTGGLGQAYQFATEEHATVIDVLRDLRRRFRVDSDRVCLLGYGEGAKMALDVGLSHPDLFAGVVPVSGAVKPFTKAYQRNSQLLPLYVVHGSNAGEFSKQNLEMAERLSTDNLPFVQVVYKGRGLESFAVELPSMFDWMSRKRRASGFPNLGEHYEFTTMRDTDNRFYWISTDNVLLRHQNNPLAFQPRINGAKLSAYVKEGNNVIVTAKGFGQVTIWLGRDSQGREMVDFTKPVSVRVNGPNGPVTLRPAKVQPSATTLLEDLFQRGDREQMVMAKIEVRLVR